MKIVSWEKCSEIEKKNILSRGNEQVDVDITGRVKAIINNVRENGDIAVKNYTRQFDGVVLENLRATAEDWESAEKLDKFSKQAIEMAYINIKNFHRLQKPKSIVLNTGDVYLTREYRAIESVGLYVPGGTAPLISTVLMLAIPAFLAGCKEIVMVTPPSKDGSIHPAIVYAAKICGITKLYKIGGAQSIAALAYGTESIPKVMKIFGPGNKYVTEAKQQVAQDPEGAALDMPAGPSEVLVIADGAASPSFVASDLLAQAEHDTDAKVILVTIDKKFSENVLMEIEKQLKYLNRKAIINSALGSGLAIIVNNIKEAVALSNNYAPEHLILQVENPRQYLENINNAGSVFIGPWSAEALGDYATGANHVLPTYGYAKSMSGFGVENFMKAIVFQEIQEQGLLNLSTCVEKLAELEGLEAHKNSVVMRRKYIEGAKEIQCTG